MMSLGELSTAVALGLHLTILIMNDDKYGMIRWKQVCLQLTLLPSHVRRWAQLAKIAMEHPCRLMTPQEKICKPSLLWVLHQCQNYCTTALRRRCG